MVTVYDFGVIQLWGATIQVSALVTLGVAAVVMVALTLFVKYSRLGRAMIAVSEDKAAAQLMGINVNRIITITFAIGSSLAALAGLFYLLKAPSVSNTLGAMPGIKAFTAAVIGGIGSIPGAMLGGILLGLVESISYKITAIAPYTDAIEFSILILILLVRPTGFLGKKRREKV
jgi:branched-chain amino acid transport system permease protein